jgi:DNA-binding transcriptional LysR family regulator
MELRHLRYFLVVAETQNIRAAAERLNLAQSALSRQIRNLESDLGLELFKRVKKRLRISPMGELLVEEARGLLAEADRAVDRIHRAAAGSAGTLHLGYQNLAARHRIVPAALDEFRTHNPGIQLQLSDGSGTRQLAAIRDRKLDGGFFYLPVRSPELGFIPLDTAHWLLAIPRNHHLAARDRLRLKNLVGEPFVAAPRSVSPIFHDLVTQACQKGGLVRNVVQEASDEISQLSMVAVGTGLCFAISTAKDYWPGDIVFKRVTDFSLSLKLALVWRRDDVSPTMERFIDAVRKLKEDNAISKRTEKR